PGPGPHRSLGHHPSCGRLDGVRRRDSAGAEVTAEFGRPSRASMTPPPSVLPGSQTGFRKTRRRAPVSDRPVVDPVAESSLPSQGDSLSVPESPEPVYVGLDWAAAMHAVCVMTSAGEGLDQSGREPNAGGRDE